MLAHPTRQHKQPRRRILHKRERQHGSSVLRNEQWWLDTDHEQSDTKRNRLRQAMVDIPRRLRSTRRQPLARPAQHAHANTATQHDTPYGHVQQLDNDRLAHQLDRVRRVSSAQRGAQLRAPVGKVSGRKCARSLGLPLRNGV